MKLVRMMASDQMSHWNIERCSRSPLFAIVGDLADLAGNELIKVAILSHAYGTNGWKMPLVPILGTQILI
ncbi:hypothetical protein KL905_000526 [Ogataea polymorpha]|nr:hypothetical protein KL935_001138 [Ogataea polymorpha]KAG7912382.1 hypothetical protein KL907_000584 [Ogataea polymorpha]KAG7918998.1 hypothetical protein KL927_001127 [Ogataea polymorpha]KAG7924372.1 hypothetical protein KL905_000526 [Ogataea polymorpha]KAG7928580.1 hypothetical protein KL925_001880 [Ogataea polymorpha]